MVEDGPIAIGGVGGSGTRVVAAVVEELGLYLGDNRNRAGDNLDYPGLERNLAVTPQPAPTVSDAEMAAFHRSMVDGAVAAGFPPSRWGWKNPPTFLNLDRFAAAFPGLRYVHVVRHGLDMALGRNQNQVRRWGHLFEVRWGEPTRERSSLAYWLRANRWALAEGERLLGDRFVVLSFDDLVRAPARSIEVLADLLDVAIDAATVDRLGAMVHAPASMGRYREHLTDGTFVDDEVAAVAQMGFAIDP